MNVGELTIEVDTSAIDEVQAKAEKLEATLLRIKEIGATATVAADGVAPPHTDISSLRIDISHFNPTIGLPSTLLSISRLPSEQLPSESAVVSLTLPFLATPTQTQYLTALVQRELSAFGLGFDRLPV